MVRLVSHMGPREHVADPEILSLGWLPIPRRVEFFSLMHVMKARLSLSPRYIARNFIRQSDAHSYGLRQANINFTLSSCQFPVGTFTRAAIAQWNSLPIELKHIQPLAAFRRRLIAFLKTR